MSSEVAGIALLWSGGKDAMLALDALLAEKAPMEAFVTTFIEDLNTVTMHGTPERLIAEQAERLGFPLYRMHVPPQAPNATYETKLERTLGPILTLDGTGVAAGDIHLEDVRAYRASIVEAMGAVPLFPLWGEDTDALAQRFLDRGYRAVVTSVDTTQLDASFVGRSYDAQFLADLPEGVDPCGENGEFHTFVTDGPLFGYPVDVTLGEPHGEGRMRYVEIG